ncbi:MAG: hypothetical protein E7555_00530 [Ruminococcaceae bacterium]|nr:hypothetical protein [Oscillospiraceae bacterium]
MIVYLFWGCILLQQYINSLPIEDKLTIELASLFEKFGYKKYCMAKFEEYSFYSDNRDFLSGEGIIAFNNSDGRLMALKPDITLSIVKNSRISRDTLTKAYYNESVYRIGKNTHDYKEIKQTGVEVLGKLDSYNISEIILLAVESLNKIDSDNILSISHMSVISELIEKYNISRKLRKSIIDFIIGKNMHDLKKLLIENEIDSDKFIEIISVSGKIDAVIEKLEKFSEDGFSFAEAIADFRMISDALEINGYKENVTVDFSVLNNTDYYNGIIFQGFVKNAPGAVLAGGRYDNLANKIRKHTEAIGFAIYLDNLNLWYPNKKEFDTDIVIINNGGSAAELLRVVKGFADEGHSVKVETSEPTDYNYKTIYTFDGCLKEGK